MGASVQTLFSFTEVFEHDSWPAHVRDSLGTWSDVLGPQSDPFGLWKGRNTGEARLRMFALDANTIIHAFQGKGAVAARLHADLERLGCKIGPLDTLIAATALARGATLVTHNQREFEPVAGLRIEDWYRDA